MCFCFDGILAQRIPSDVIYIEKLRLALNAQFNNKAFRKTSSHEMKLFAGARFAFVSLFARVTQSIIIYKSWSIKIA